MSYQIYFHNLLIFDFNAVVLFLHQNYLVSSILLGQSFCTKTSSGEATKSEEYVPTKTPIASVSEK
jgi:hypothetical protein